MRDLSASDVESVGYGESRLEALQKSGEEEWEQLRSELENAWEDLSHSINTLVARVKDEFD